MELSEDCLSVKPESDTQVFQSPNKEAPAVFFYGNQYYLWTSGVMGWVATTMHLYTASSPLGAFNASGANGTDQDCPIGILPPPIPNLGDEGNRIADGQPGLWAYGSQSTYILPNPLYSSADKSRRNLAQFIYMADRWKPDTDEFGQYVWLPLFINPRNTSEVKVVWHESWRLDNAISPFEFDEAHEEFVSSVNS
jgi:hypothetical protein